MSIGNSCQHELHQAPTGTSVQQNRDPCCNLKTVFFILISKYSLLIEDSYEYIIKVTLSVLHRVAVDTAVLVREKFVLNLFTREWWRVSGTAPLEAVLVLSLIQGVGNLESYFLNENWQSQRVLKSLKLWAVEFNQVFEPLDLWKSQNTCQNVPKFC